MKSPSIWRHARAGLGALVVIVLAAGLVLASLRAYQGTLDQQQATLTTQLFDVANRYIHDGLRQRAHHQEDLRPMLDAPIQDGYDAYITNAAGDVLVATRPEWESTSRLREKIASYAFPQPITVTQRPNDGFREACIRLPPSRRAQEYKRQGGREREMTVERFMEIQGADFPQWYCLSVPPTHELPEIAGARQQLVFSLVGSLALLGLGLGLFIAQRREANLRLLLERRRHLAELGQLGATLAHEIRTPLAAIRGFSQLLHERTEAQEKRIRRPAEKIVEETDRLGRLVDDLLSYARPAAPRFAEVELEAHLRGVAERLAPLAAQRGARLLCETHGSCTAEVDPDRLTQLLDNLTRNALSFTPKGEVVLLRLASNSSQVVFEICDRGPGVPEDQRETIFAPFFTTRSEGTGLGLAVCKRIADEHNGNLYVEPREGGGSCFHLDLPHAQPQPLLDAAPHPPHA